MNVTYYIYAVICPETKAIKYVGRSINIHERLLQHYSSSGYGSPIALRDWLRSIEPVNPEIAILEKVENDKLKANDREKHWIRKLSEQYELFNAVHVKKGRASRLREMKVHDLSNQPNQESILNHLKKSA